MSKNKYSFIYSNNVFYCEIKNDMKIFILILILFIGAAITHFTGHNISDYNWGLFVTEDTLLVADGGYNKVLFYRLQ